MVQVPAEATASISDLIQELMDTCYGTGVTIPSECDEGSCLMLTSNSMPYSAENIDKHCVSAFIVRLIMRHQAHGLGAVKAILTCYYAQPGGCQMRPPSR